MFGQDTGWEGELVFFSLFYSVSSGKQINALRNVSKFSFFVDAWNKCGTYLVSREE